MSSITINSNTATLNAQRGLSRSTSSLKDSLARLATGLRINKASDDAAGLAIAESLSTDRAVLQQGVRNLNDGVSYLNIADAALEEASNILIRIEELSVQSANGVHSSEQREALDSEAQALKNEFSRIIDSTVFNDRNIFSTETEAVTLATGVASSELLDVDFREQEVTTAGLGSYTTQNVTGAVGLTGQDGRASFGYDFNEDGIDDAAFLYLTLDGGATMRMSYLFSRGDTDGVYAADQTGSTDIGYAGGFGGTFTAEMYDDGGDGDMDLRWNYFLSAQNYSGTLINNNGSFTLSGISFASNGATGGTLGTTGDFNGDGVQDTATITSTGPIFTAQFSTQDTEVTEGPGFEKIEIGTFTLANQSGARSAIDTVQAAREEVTGYRGKIGASLSRIAVAVSVGAVISEEYSAAESRIRDTDVARESAKLVRNQILQQAGVAVLGQANQGPALAIELLESA